MIDYRNQINHLHNWIQSANNQLKAGAFAIYPPYDAQQVKTQIAYLASYIENEYPFYAHVLRNEKDNLFFPSRMNPGKQELNLAAFGETFVIIQHIYAEPINLQFWQNIHPLIQQVSKQLYADGYYSSAYDAAIKAVETRLRELFKEAKPGAPLPKEPSQLIGALLSDNCPYVFCDTSDISGQNFRKGTKEIFDGVFTAYRNPTMHANMNYTQKEAFEQIVQASQMMTILTQGEIKK